MTPALTCANVARVAYDGDKGREPDRVNESDSLAVTATRLNRGAKAYA